MLHIRLIMQAEVGAGAVLEVHDVAEHTGSPGCRGELSERRLTRLIGAQRSDEAVRSNAGTSATPSIRGTPWSRTGP